jgi:SAM-dependent methyltransferase
MPEFTGENQERIWKHFQNDAPASFDAAVPRLNYLLKQIGHLSKHAKPTVLNIGVGSGYFERQALSSGWRVYALDPDGDTMARLAREGVAAHQGRIEKIPLESATFDFVVASEVLEHLTVSQRAAGLQEIARVLKPGGWFLGTVPYEEDLAAGQVVCPDCGIVFHRWGHLMSFTRDSMARELAPHFQNIRVSRTAFVDFSRGLGGNVKSLLRLILAKCGQQIAVPSILWRVQKL